MSILTITVLSVGSPKDVLSDARSVMEMAREFRGETCVTAQWNQLITTPTTAHRSEMSLQGHHKIALAISHGEHQEELQCLTLVDLLEVHGGPKGLVACSIPQNLRSSVTEGVLCFHIDQLAWFGAEGVSQSLRGTFGPTMAVVWSPKLLVNCTLHCGYHNECSQ